MIRLVVSSIMQVARSVVSSSREEEVSLIIGEVGGYFPADEESDV